MATVGRVVVRNVGLGASAVVLALAGSPWPLIILGAAVTLVVGTLAAVVVAAAFSRSRGRQAGVVLERLTAFGLGLRWPPTTLPNTATTASNSGPRNKPPLIRGGFNGSPGGTTETSVTCSLARR